MTVNHLIHKVLAGEKGKVPDELFITGASYIYQTTQFPQTTKKYHNTYLLLRVDSYFGACCHLPEQVHISAAEELSGVLLSQGLKDPRLPAQIASLDAYFGSQYPHREYCQEVVTLPSGSPVIRANFRDELIVRLANIKKGEKVALIGVVNPLVKAIKDAGGLCLPCDLQMETTQWGDPIEKDMHIVLNKADCVISTAMTLSNGTFDTICQITQERNIPLTIYGQTGSAVVAQFMSRGVTNLLAEPFPFSQFTADESKVYIYKSK